MSGRRRWFDRTSEEIYAYRCRKPWALVGLPFIGRHWGYAGRTNNGKRRDGQHRFGYVWDGQEHPPKPWADLIVRRYVIFRKKPRLEITTHFLEWFTIRLLLPVYNVSMNAGNPRRIKPWEQKRQRAERLAWGRARQPLRVWARGFAVLACWVAAGLTAWVVLPPLAAAVG